MPVSLHPSTGPPLLSSIRWYSAEGPGGGLEDSCKQQDCAQCCPAGGGDGHASRHV